VKTNWLTGPDRALTRFGEVPAFREGLYQVGPSSYAWMVPNGSWGESNLGLIDCSGKSVLIDTCWDLKYTREVLQAAQFILVKSPVECVINTHSDGDHCWGNQLFKDKEIIATHACIRQMHHMNPRSIRAFKYFSKLLCHTPFLRMARFGHYMKTMFAPYDFTGITIVDPNHGFSGVHEFSVNGVGIVVMEVGPGHTDGDAIVFVPSQQLAYAGDLLFAGVTPVMWSGPIENIVRGLEKLRSLRATTIVSGHGPFATDQMVQSMINYWNFIHEKLHQCYQQGMLPLEAAKSVLFSTAFQETEFAKWDSPERLMSNAHTLYRQWGVDLPGPSGVMALMRNQAAVAFELPEATPRCMHGKCKAGSGKREAVEMMSAFKT
jgi:cyclase